MNPHHRRYVIAVAMLLLVTAAASGVRILVRDGASANQNQQDANAVKSPDTSKWKLYRNKKYGFQVKYPEFWAVRASKGTPREMIYFGGPYLQIRCGFTTKRRGLRFTQVKMSAWAHTQR